MEKYRKKENDGSVLKVVEYVYTTLVTVPCKGQRGMEEANGEQERKENSERAEYDKIEKKRKKVRAIEHEYIDNRQQCSAA